MLTSLSACRRSERRQSRVQHGCVWRVVERNGHQYVITMDLRLNRVDLTIDHGMVTAASAG
jgi:hypothetical protein